MTDAKPMSFGNAPVGTDLVHRPAAYAVIRNSRSDVLAINAINPGPGWYWLPGGRIEADETPELAIRRECVEELGCEVRVGARIGNAVQLFFSTDDDCWFRMEAAFFEASLINTPDGTGEFDFEWLNVDQQSSHFFHECHRWACCRPVFRDDDRP